MSFFSNFFNKKEKSASVAKDRLLITLSKERASNAFGNMEDMKRDIIAVVQKYTSVKDVSVTTKKNQDIDSIEISLSLNK